MQLFPIHDRALRGWLSGVLAAVAIALPMQASALGLVVSEVSFEAVGGENGKQWIELYNDSASTIDLSLYSLGWGRDDYTEGTLQLSGFIDPYETYLIGGPYSGPDNANPAPYDMVYNFDKDLGKGNAGKTDGVALFLMPVADIDATSVPFFAVIYGRPTAATVLLDATGAVGSPSVTADPFNGAESIELQADGSWIVQSTPTPGVFLTPEPGTGVLLGTGLALLGGFGQRRRRRPQRAHRDLRLEPRRMSGLG